MRAPPTRAARSLSLLAGGLRRLGVLLALGFAAWVAGDAVRIAVEVARDEGASGALREPLLALVLAQLVLVVPLFARGGSERLGRTPTLLALAAGLVAALAWLDLRRRAAWSPWCWALVGFALLLPWLVQRPRWRAAARALFAAGYGVAALAGFTLGSGYCWYPIPGTPPSGALDRDERWREDLAYLGRELVRLHGNAFHTLPRAELERRLTGLVASVPKRTDDELALEVTRLVAALGDAHTECRPRLAGEDRRLPVGLEWFGDELVLTGVPADRLELAGRRVRALAGTPVAELEERLEPLVSHENRPWLRAQTPDLMTRSDLLHLLGLVPEPGAVGLELEDERGRVETVVLEAVPTGRPVVVTQVVSGTPRLEPRPDAIWSEELTGERALYFRYARCDPSLALLGFSRELFARLDAAPELRLVVDLRGNGGGATFPFDWWVLPGILRRPELNRPERLFVLIDRGTFSSAVDLALELAVDTEATLVGEPTGGKPNSWGEVRLLELPYSRLKVSYATRWQEHEPGRDRPSLEPDVLVEETWDDRSARRDPALEWVLAAR